MCFHQFLPELCHEPLVLVRHDHQWQSVLADNVAEEGIGYGTHVCTLQRDQHYHLPKMVHDHHDGVVPVVFWQVRDEVDVGLLPQGLQNWQRLVQTSQPTCVGLVLLANITALTILQR